MRCTLGLWPVEVTQRPEMGQNVPETERIHRPYKTGSVESRGDGKWRLRVVVKDPGTGRLIRKSKTVQLPTRGFKGKLEKAMRDFQDEAAKMTVTGATATLGTLLDHWLENIDRPGKATNTMESYRRYVEKRIRPALGAIRLDQLTTHDVDRFYAKLESELSPRSVQLIHSVLRSALTQGVDWGWIGSNPALKATRTKPKTRQIDSLTVEQVNEIYDRAEEPVRLAIGLAAVLGARRSELCGLQWADIDPDAGTIRIERAWVPTNSGQQLSTTKTGYHRTIPLGAVGTQLLEDYEREKRLRWTELGPWILSDGNGDEPLKARVLTDSFRSIVKAMGIEGATFHFLRHFHDSMNVAQGVDVVTAARRSGHTTKVMLEIYAHGTREQDELAANVVGNLLTAARLKPQLSQPESTIKG